MKRWGLLKKLFAAICIICLLFTSLLIFAQASLFKTAFQNLQTDQFEADTIAAQEYLSLYLQQMKDLTFSAAMRRELKDNTPERITNALEQFVDQSAVPIHTAFFVDTQKNVYSSRQLIYRVLQITMDYDKPIHIANHPPYGAQAWVSEPYRSSMSTQQAVAFARRVYDSGHYIGTVILEVTLEQVSKAIQSAVNLSNHSFLVASASGGLIFQIENFPVENATIERILLQPRGWTSYQDDLGAYRAYTAVGLNADWHIILIADESSLYDSIELMILRSAAISFALLMSLMVAVVVLVRHFTIPLRHLAAVMNRLGDEDKLSLGEQLDITRQDEIGDLTRAFQNLLDRISHLIQRQQEIERSRTHAEIRALQHQLRPHFLYNSLNAISALVLEGKADKVPTAISALIRLLAMCTDKTDAMVTLEEEVQTARYYLDIMTLRYGDRFDAAVQLPTELSNCIVPKLVLQPLVENAIFHGLHSTGHHGMLEIEAARAEDGNLVLSVMDDGVGISAEKIESLLTAEGSAHSTGLYNTHSRIQLYFGQHYGLRIHSISGIGTRVDAILPYRQMNQEEDTKA